jgi:hypothetical protein
MQWIERVRTWIEGNDRGIMTVGVWILVAACFAIFICYAVKCYYLLS